MTRARSLAGGVAARFARWPRLTAFALGAATTPAFAPFHLWYLLPLLLAGLFWLWRRLPPRAAARAGFAYGAGLFLTGTYWLYISVHVFGRAPLWLAIFLMLGLVLIMALYYALTGWLVARLAGRSRLQFVAVAPAAWVAAEWLRGWVLSGFPWLSLGYAQLDSPLAGYMPVLGVYGVSFAVSLLAALLVVALSAPARVAAASLAAGVLLVAAGWALTRVDYTEPAGDWLDVALVQGSIDQDRKWLREERLPTLALYRDLTLARRDIDVFVWPEVALPALKRAVEPYLDALSRRLARDGA
ncbi:MAG: apolipoprotein N-acyltransferase, partial [Pseudomonadota bacterium]